MVFHSQDYSGSKHFLGNLSDHRGVQCTSNLPMKKHSVSIGRKGSFAFVLSTMLYTMALPSIPDIKKTLCSIPCRNCPLGSPLNSAMNHNRCSDSLTCTTCYRRFFHHSLPSPAIHSLMPCVPDANTARLVIEKEQMLSFFRKRPEKVTRADFFSYSEEKM